VCPARARGPTAHYRTTDHDLNVVLCRVACVYRPYPRRCHYPLIRIDSGYGDVRAGLQGGFDLARSPQVPYTDGRLRRGLRSRRLGIRGAAPRIALRGVLDHQLERGDHLFERG
jgi:hypothetical protein